MATKPEFTTASGRYYRPMLRRPDVRNRMGGAFIPEAHVKDRWSDQGLGFMQTKYLDAADARRAAHAAAWEAYSAARTAYRNREIGDEEYLEARAAWEADQDAFDAERGEQAR